MKVGNIITAIDIGTTKICVIIAQKNEDSLLEVRGIGTSKSDGLFNGVVVDIMKSSKSIHEAIHEAELMADLKAKNIYFGIAGDHIKSQNTLGRISLTSGTHPCEITQVHIDDAITNSKNNVKLQQGNERLEIIHAIPQYFKIDDMKGIMNPLNMSGFNLSVYVHIVMADGNALKNIAKCIEITGYKVQKIFVEPIASSNSVLNEVERELGSIIIDIGGGTTDIAVFYKNSIRFSAVLPLGGTNITNDIAVGLHTSPQNSEEIKINKGSTLASSIPKDKYIEIEGIAGRSNKKKKLRYISEIIEARMREIFEGSYNLLDDQYDLSSITAGLTLTGGASLLKGSEKLAEKIFNMSTKIGYPYLNNLAGPTERLENPKFATAVGILYQAFKEQSEKESKIINYKTADPIMNFFKKVSEFFKDFV